MMIDVIILDVMEDKNKLIFLLNCFFVYNEKFFMN